MDAEEFQFSLRILGGLVGLTIFFWGLGLVM